jgi:release factor glutamine methyltransferase
MTIAELLNTMRDRIRVAEISDSPMMEAQWIMEMITGLHRPELLAHSENEVSAEHAARALELTARYTAGEPLPYLLGDWHFYGNRFLVTPAVLIPRPETERLVELAINWLQDHTQAKVVLDIGTGSGCIAITLLKSRKLQLAQVTACDLSFEALMQAQQNGQLNCVQDRLQLVQSDLSTSFSEPIDIVCANLPYIPSARLPMLDVSRHEPRLALDGGSDGFDLYRRLFNDLTGKMAAESLILCAIDLTHETIGADIAQQAFPQAEISVIRDYEGLPRVLSIAHHPTL